MALLISYINLPERSDRRDHMESLLRNCAHQVTRIEGIRLATSPEDSGLRMQQPFTGSKSIASIFLSHRKALEQAHNSALSGGFVLLEDDCQFTTSAFNRALKFKNPPDDWDIIMVSPRFRDRAEAAMPRKKLTLRDRLNPFRKSRWKRPLKRAGYVKLSLLMDQFVVSGAHFVIFKDKTTIAKVLDKMHKLEGLYHVDYFYAGTFNTYGIDVKGVMAGGFGSDNRS